MFYCDSHNLKECLELVLTNNPLPLFDVHVRFGLRETSSSRVFSENSSRNYGFSGRVFVSRIVFHYLTPSCQFMEPCSSASAFAKQPLVFFDF